MPDLPHITQNFTRPSYRPEAPSGIDPEMRRMALLAAGFGGLVALIVAAASLLHHTHQGVPVIQALAGPVRVKPADPGGMKVAMGMADDSAGVERLDPPAEQPEIRALHAKQALAEAHAARPAPAPVAAPVPAPVAPMAARAPTPEPAPAIDGPQVQLAAFDSQAAAEAEWHRLAGRMPALFDNHQPAIEKASIANRTVWRLRTGGFTSIATATEFCVAVRDHGGDCSIAAF